MSRGAPRPLVCAMILLLGGAIPAARTAEPPEPARSPTRRSTAPGLAVSSDRPAPRATVARRASGPAAGRSTQAEAEALPSSVSSDIAQFVSQSGTAPLPSTAPLVTPPRPDRDAIALPQPLPPPLATMPGRRVPVVSPPSPLATAFRLAAAPFGPSDVRLPINLATALRLSDARPLIVAAAQARTWIAEGELMRARYSGCRRSTSPSIMSGMMVAARISTRAS